MFLWPILNVEVVIKMENLDIPVFILTITLILKVTANEETNIENIIETEKNMFHKVNGDLQILTNMIFTVIKLNKTFAETYNNDLLIQMHEHLKRINEYNYVVLLEIQNISRVEPFGNKSVFNMTKAVQDVLENNEDRNEIDNKTRLEYIRVKQNSTKSNTSEGLASIEFINTLLAIMDNLDLNYTGPNTRILEGFENSRRMNNRKYDLKKWQPLNFTQSNASRRVYHGSLTTIQQFPFMASIHVLNAFTCAGAVVSKDLVITAASCLQVAYTNRQDLTSPNSLAVRVGSDFSSRLGDLLPISEVHFHPEYGSEHLRNNQALARVPGLGKTPGVRRILYQRTVPRFHDDAEVTILGWGDKDSQIAVENQEFAPLSIARLNLYNLANCKEAYTSKFVSEQNFCAGFINRGGGACSRDLGGPGIVSGVLTGVISFGPPVCGTPDAPTVFTHVGYYARWIDSVVWKEVPSNASSQSATLRKNGLNSQIMQNSRKSHIPSALEFLKSVFNKIVITGGGSNEGAKIEIQGTDEVSKILENFERLDSENKKKVQTKMAEKVKRFRKPTVSNSKADIQVWTPPFSKTVSNKYSAFTKTATKKYLRQKSTSADKLSTITDPEFIQEIQNVKAFIEPKYLKEIKQKLMAAEDKGDFLREKSRIKRKKKNKDSGKDFNPPQRAKEDKRSGVTEKKEFMEYSNMETDIETPNSAHGERFLGQLSMDVEVDYGKKVGRNKNGKGYGEGVNINM